LKPKKSMRLSGSTSRMPKPNDTRNQIDSSAALSFRLARQYALPLPLSAIVPPRSPGSSALYMRPMHTEGFVAPPERGRLDRHSE
jgi:hypothetical protein